MTAALDHLDDLAAFVRASPSSFHAAEEAGRRLADAGFAELLERGRVARRARSLLRDPRRRRHRLDRAERRATRNAVPDRRRAHRLARIQTQAEAHDRITRLAAGRSRGLRRSPLQLLARPRARARRAPRVRRRLHCAGAHRPDTALPATGRAPRPRGQQRGPGPQPADPPEPRARNSGEHGCRRGRPARVPRRGAAATRSPATTWSSPTRRRRSASA